ncbi:hypothetical protein L596_014340 [Steinernema carpocapsae]|uniref:Probable prefoldin subunit 6 n=1 Tax=Steinernema carpocapsae TaxID=34508 RepID=A0A4U5NBP6_STECR|nr:hypothetical protein L596_014340 [Steinernema carpocapsae]
MNKLETLKSKFEVEVEKLKKLEKEKEKIIAIRHQLEGQKTENQLVEEEFKHLKEDAVVYKLIGPVLVKQDFTEAQSNVEKRLEYITREIERAEKQITANDEKIAAQTEALTKSQAVLKRELAVAHAKA